MLGPRLVDVCSGLPNSMIFAYGSIIASDMPFLGSALMPCMICHCIILCKHLYKSSRYTVYPVQCPGHSLCTPFTRGYAMRQLDDLTPHERVGASQSPRANCVHNSGAALLINHVLQHLQRIQSTTKASSRCSASSAQQPA